MVAIALWLACDPDYPVPRAQLAAGGASDTRPGTRPSRPAAHAACPQPLEPRGVAARAALTFRWQWSGPPAEWRVVVLDEALEQIVGFRGTSTNSATPASDSLALLPRGLRGHWLVEARLADRVLRSLPVPFALLD